MSQTGNTFLDDVRSWNADQCRDGLETALPKLIYGNGASMDNKISILKVLVDNFLSHISLDVLEPQMLSTILPQTKSLYDKILCDITNHLSKHATDVQDSVLHCLKLLVSMIESLCSCVHQVTSQCKEYGGAVSMEQIQSLPCATLYIVKESFSHCKDSNELYGDHFSAASETLSALFKKAYGLQKTLMALLDTVHLSAQDGDEIIGKMVQVVNGFHELCCIISSMDSTLMVSTWRFVVKLASKHKEFLKDVLEISSLINSLCSDIEHNYDHCLQVAPLQPSLSSSQRDEKAFLKTLKICNLCIKMLMHLLKEFDGYIGDCHTGIYHMVIAVQSLAPPSVHAPDISSNAQNELNKSVLVCIEPLLQLLLSNLNFCEVVLVSEQDLTKSQWFSRLLTLLHILKIIPNTTPDIHAAWVAPEVFPEDQPRESIFQAVFTTVKKCYVEFNIPVHLPGIMCNGMAQRDISLQEYVTTHLCGYVAAVPAQHFGIIERILLTSVLDGDINVVLVAMDVWCFLARYGSAELCYTQVNLIANLLTPLPVNSSPAYMHLCMLLRRLLPLMKAEDQASFITRYHPRNSLSLWCHLPLLAFPEAARSDLFEQIARTCVERCQTWMCKETNPLGSLGQVTTSLQALCNVYRQYESSQPPPISNHLQDSIKNMVCQLWQRLPLDKIGSHDLMYVLINQSGLLVHVLNPDSLLNILSQIERLMQCGNNSTVQLRLATVALLRQLGKICIPSCNQQTPILQHICRLFSMVLADKHWLVHQLALQAFSTFAEETGHESVVPECLQNETVQRLAVQFLSKEPRSVTSEVSEIEFLEEQLQHLCTFAKQQQQQQHKQQQQQNNSTNGTNQPSTSTSIPKEPATKRAKYDDTALHEAVNQVKAGLHRIKELKDVNPVLNHPSWLMDELAMLRDQVVELM